MTAVSFTNAGHQPAPPGPSEPISFTPGIGGVIHTTDADRLNELAPGWVEQTFQLGRGQFEGSLAFGQTSGMQFGVKDWRPGLLIRGSAPRGATVIGVPLEDSSSGRLRGLTIGPNEMGYLAQGEDVDFRSTTPYRMFIIAIAQERLEAHALAVLGHPLQALVRGNRLSGSHGIAERTREVERLGLDAIYRSAQRLNDPQVASWVENRVLDTLLSGLSSAGRRTFMPGGAELARRAEEYLITNLRAPLTIRDLCTAMRASERTLHQAFKVHLGTTPKAHLKALRLNAVRRELRQAAPGVGVMDVAVRWGFFHAGWLSQDYRRMFGESPSRSLAARDASTAALAPGAGSR